MNILVVEDNPTDLKLVSAVLQLSGHEVLGNATAEQALSELKGRKSQIILLDLKLPGMSGLEFARRVKADPATRHIVIIALTAETEVFGRREALEAGCDAYIVKPVDTRRLSDQITSIAAH